MPTAPDLPIPEECGDGPTVMGIVNATPDSFSGDGRRHGVDELVEQGRELHAEGAAIIDVGGESGVTNRPPVPASEEIARVVPVIERLAGEGIPVSVDTWKAEVAEAALSAGAGMVNDVSGLRDPGMAPVCAAAGAALVITHTRVAPKVKGFPSYEDLVADVVGLLKARVAAAAEHGVRGERIVLDPGVDLSKTPAQTVEVLRRLREVCRLGHPVLLAVSRKDFIGALTRRRPRERLAGTLAAVGAGVDAGASIVRVHDVAAVIDYLAVREALSGPRTVPDSLALAEGLRRERQSS